MADFTFGQSGGPVVFKRLRAEAFRGFAEPVDIDLRGSVVIVYGPNGLGKTSLFDALQWALLGELSRLRDARLRQTDEYIVNAYRPGAAASVEVEFSINGRNISLSRSGNRQGSVLTLVLDDRDELTGPQAEAALTAVFTGSDELDLTATLTACGLLQQDAARQVLTAKPRDRFGIFSLILGLGELSDIETWSKTQLDALNAQLREVGRELAQAELAQSQAASRLATLEGSLAKRPLVSDVRDRLLLRMQAEGFPATTPFDDRDAAARLATVASAQADEANRLAREMRRLRAEASTLPSRDQLADAEELAGARQEAEATLAAVRDELGRATEQLRSLESAQRSLARMASAVLPQLHGPTCPVCGQAVDESELRLRLQELEAGLSTVDAQQRVSVLAQRTQAAEEAVDDLVKVEQDRVRAEAQFQQWTATWHQLSLGAMTLASSERTLRLPEFDVGAEDAVERLEAHAQSLTVVATAARELMAAWDASTSQQEAMARTAAEHARQRYEAVREKHEVLAGARADAERIHEAVRDARLDVVRSEFARLSPLAQDIYSRLDPHPTFQDIDLVSETFRSVGTTVAQVRDSVAAVAADPMVVFSSAQANMAAISYLMALNLASSSGAPVLLLDDPLQAMDDVNVLGFADLCSCVPDSGVALGPWSS